MYRFFVRTATQAALFECELQGQISDGYWENRPGNHWQGWSSCKVEVADKQVGRDFPVQTDRYALDHRELLTVVGDRMLVIARLAKAGFNTVQIRSMQDLWETSHYDREKETWSGLSNPSPKWLGVDEQMLEHVSVEYWQMARLAVQDTSYGYKELRADLRDLKVAMRVRLHNRNAAG